MNDLRRLVQSIRRESPMVSRLPIFVLAALSVYVVFGMVWLLTEPMRAQVARPTRTPLPSFTAAAATDRLLVATATRTSTPTASPSATRTPTPSRTPTRTPTATPTVELAQHLVRRGETLTTIAARYEVEVAEFMTLNGLSESDVLVAGQSLLLPPDARVAADNALVHVVRSGDTVWGIASVYGADYASLLRVNGLGPNDLLQEGQQLIIPE